VLPEVLAELYVLSGLVTEMDIKRDLVVQALLDSHILKGSRQLVLLDACRQGSKLGRGRHRDNEENGNTESVAEGPVERD